MVYTYLSLDRSRPLSPHDPDGVPRLHVVVVDEVAGAHHTGPAATLGTVNTNSLGMAWPVILEMENSTTSQKY